MNRPEEQQEPAKGDDYGKGLGALESAGSAQLENKTAERPGLDALSEEKTRGHSAPKATIIPEDSTPKGPTQPERDLEESRRFTGGSAEREIEATPDHVPLPEAADKGDGPGAFWRLKKYQKAMGSVVIVLCVLFLVYGFSRLVKCRHEERQRMPSVQVYWSPVEKSASDVLNFARFLVLLPKTDEAAYLLLKISVKPSNRSVYEEMDEKRIFLRASIYAVLNKEVRINKGERITMKTLKPAIAGALNSMLVTGTIDRIYFTEFLVV